MAWLKYIYWLVFKGQWPRVRPYDKNVDEFFKLVCNRPWHIRYAKREENSLTFQYDEYWICVWFDPEYTVINRLYLMPVTAKNRDAIPDQSDFYGKHLEIVNGVPSWYATYRFFQFLDSKFPFNYSKNRKNYLSELLGKTEED